MLWIWAMALPPRSPAPAPHNNCFDCSHFNLYVFSTQPCGEYLFDFRNGSMLQNWIVDELIAGPTGVGAKEIDGLFIDDYWCSDLICKADSTVAGCPCNDPVQGPTEINKYSQSDIGLSDEDIRAITLGWNDTMGKVQQKILDMHGYTWSLIKVLDPTLYYQCLDLVLPPAEGQPWHP